MAKPVDMSKFLKNIDKSTTISRGFNDPEVWIDSGHYLLNYFISGHFRRGIPLSKVSMFAGESGCLPEYAKVKIKYNTKNNNYVEQTVTVLELNNLYKSNQYNIEIETPDGWNQVTEWFDKGELSMYKITSESFETICAYNHLIQLDNNEWRRACDLTKGDTIQTSNGQESVLHVEDLDRKEQCYDFTVNHPNHRYYGDGIVSHNSGKSFIVSGALVREAQKMGIIPVIIDTENALDEEWLNDLGVDTSPDNLLKFNMSKVNDVAKVISQFMEWYKQTYDGVPKEEQQAYLFVVDSLGMLNTDNDEKQFNDGNMKGDMGLKAKQLKAMIQQTVHMIAPYNIGMVCTNHTYASQDMFDPEDKISGGCLIENTLVQMSDNTSMPIEKIKVGDNVKTLNGVQKVLNTWHYKKETYTIKTLDGHVIECSPEHKFYVYINDHLVWLEAENLQVDSLLSRNDCVYSKVSSISKNNNIKDVYDIEVENDHHYILDNGIVSHNSGPVYAASIVTAMKKRKDKDGSEVVGIKAQSKVMKSRYGRAFITADVIIDFKTGLRRYSGLLDHFIKLGIVTQGGPYCTYIDKNGEEHKSTKSKFEADDDLMEKIIDEFDYEKHSLKSKSLVEEEEKELEINRQKQQDEYE